MAKTICDNCIHDGVCGLEGHLDEALTFCVNKSTGVPMKRGKWLHINDDGIIFCSECNNEAYWDSDYGQQLFDYCPYCGADMRNDSNLMETEVEGLFLNFEQGENND